MGEICDRMRQNQLTEEDCDMLTYQRRRFPDVCTDYGIHYLFVLAQPVAVCLQCHSARRVTTIWSVTPSARIGTVTVSDSGDRCQCCHTPATFC